MNKLTATINIKQYAYTVKESGFEFDKKMPFCNNAQARNT